MEIDILDSLEDLGYEGPEREEAGLEEAVKTVGQLGRLVAWLAAQLQELLGLESSVWQGEEDPLNFQLEVSSLLKEIHCPHSQLTDGPLEQRLDSQHNRLLLLDYLCSEVQAAHILAAREKDCAMEVDTGSESLEHELESVSRMMGLDNIPVGSSSIAALAGKVEEALKKAKHLPEPLLETDLTSEQWDQLYRLDAAFITEYQLRRQMLITRLDSTITSFGWADRLKDKQEEITAIYLPLRAHMKPQPSVHLADLLAARSDLLEIEKTSSANLRKNTRSSVNKVVIGPVPDRGGRPEETNPPPPEMPSWKLRSGPPAAAMRGGPHGRGSQGGQKRGGNFNNYQTDNRQQWKKHRRH